MKIIICIVIVALALALAYAIGVRVGQTAIKTTCPGIIKIARDEEDKGYYCALEIKGKETLEEIYESDTVTLEVQRMSETQIKQRL